MVKRTTWKKKNTNIYNELDYWYCPNIKTLYKDNLNIKICENHNNLKFKFTSDEFNFT